MSAQSARLAEIPCEDKPSQIHLFFAREKIDFNYQKIALVESTGDEYATNDQLLNRLRYEAWQNCADGIIHIESEFKEKTDNNWLDDDDEDEIYSVRTFTGIAVKILKDSSFMAHQSSIPDTSFIASVRAENALQARTENAATTASVVVVLLSVALLLGIVATVPSLH